MQRLQQRLTAKEYTLKIDDDALDYLAQAGYDPVYGARPLRRALQNYLENPLAEAILSGKFIPGSTIRAVLKGDQINFL